MVCPKDYQLQLSWAFQAVITQMLPFLPSQKKKAELLMPSGNEEIKFPAEMELLAVYGYIPEADTCTKKKNKTQWYLRQTSH